MRHVFLSALLLFPYDTLGAATRSFPAQSRVPLPSVTRAGDRRRDISRRGSVVVVQYSAETLSPFYFSSVPAVCGIWADQLVIQALMVALSMIQLSSATPILGMKFATRGMPGMAEQYGCMRAS
jgi:hypothetical protein